jgi:hypothetical protein
MQQIISNEFKFGRILHFEETSNEEKVADALPSSYLDLRGV